MASKEDSKKRLIDQGMCIFMQPWQGRCGNVGVGHHAGGLGNVPQDDVGTPMESVGGKNICKYHEGEACRVCGEQAVGKCGVASSLVCGIPYCEDHGCAQHGKRH